jgi:putative heme-binding domain-containing protein
VAVGPDLFGIRNQPKESILLLILVPNREITTGYAAYLVLTTDGRSLVGLVVSETPTSITLRLPLGKEEVLLRQDIDELVASTNSLMPDGMEKTISRQELADLLAYLKGEWRGAGDASVEPPAEKN